MNNIITKLKILEIKLKTSGPIGYIIYCMIGITVMFIVWGVILMLGYTIFLTLLIIGVPFAIIGFIANKK